MKPVFFILAVVGVCMVAGGLLYIRSLSGVQTAQASESTKSFYGLKTKSLEGKSVDLADYSGKVSLVVNLASKCGLTPQYEGLEALYRELSPRGFVILGFPSNDFMGQEPGTPQEIRTFCSTEYDVTFPLFEKVRVKGDDKGEIYSLLTGDLKEPDWNFTKYLVDADGNVVHRFGPRTTPDDQEMREKILALLPAGD
jgi:glutathione peroxidase